MTAQTYRPARCLTTWLLVAGFAGWGSLGAQTNTVLQATPRLPSVILIVADELGYGDLGCYGQKMIPTPRMDSLAGSGIRFTNFYVGSASDSDARAALLTGQGGDALRNSGNRTLAERLKEAGYHTGCIGYWGLGGFDSMNAPQRRGFDVVVAYGDRRHSHDLFTGYLYRRDPHTGFEDSMRLAANPPGKKGAYLPDLLTQAALRFCKQNKPEKLNSYRPFFLLLSYPVPAAIAARSGPVPEAEAYTAKDWPAIQKEKASAISRLDQHVGELLKELEERGMAENTIVLLTSSMGPEKRDPLDPEFFDSTGPFSTGEGSLSEGRLRVPLIVRWPFWMKRGGGVSDLLLSANDIVPTVIEAARVEIPEGMAGISFLPTLLGETQTNKHEYLNWKLVDDEGEMHQAMRFEHWKACRQVANQPWRLYDLAVDSGEQTDLADQRPEIIVKIKAVSKEPTERGVDSAAPASGQ